MLPPPTNPPRATYRFQFTGDFGFEEARGLVPYLAQLGISDLYASPILQASSTSTHGYDVNDYTRISSLLGGRNALDKLSVSLRDNHIGLLVDFVPNHMGIDGEFNVWWSDVLENGEHSRFAAFFDIEWHPRLERLANRVLVPILGDHYGTVLERGDLSLQYDGLRFLIRYGNHKLPIRPRCYGRILNRLVERLPSGDEKRALLHDLGEAFENLPPHDLEERAVQFLHLREVLGKMIEADAVMGKLLQETLIKLNGVKGDPMSFGFLHELLEEQHYRVAYWKVGAHEVNYRRFFAVDTLVGIKMEKPEVFAATHHLLGELIADGTVSGIRLDHIDGLWNPAAYLLELADWAKEKSPEHQPLYTLVEKILAAGEKLPDAWMVHGTTGYEFAASLIDLFLDREKESAWTRIYGNFIGERATSLDLTYEDKLFVIQEIFPNAVLNLAVELDNLIEPDWRWRDLSQHDLKTAIRHLLACLPLYRTYRMPGEEMVPYEKKAIYQAMEEAIRRNPCIDPVPVRFLASVLARDYLLPHATLEQQRAFDHWVCKFQQATGAVMAKSVEDTHFYRYVRMMGANEVGSHPSHFGQPIAAFHEANLQRLKEAPYCMLATSTHDTKMSEDARARLFALAELPDEWESSLRKWHEMNLPHHQSVQERSAPDSREEYLLYQALLAAWPLGMEKPDAVFGQRMKDYFRKAKGEAKLNTTWMYPHEEWQAAGDRFIDAILGSAEFRESFLPFAKRIAYRGMIFSIAQTTLKLTSPGVPDIYQGNEIWDFSLVDPDNRRPVDFGIRQELLAALDQRSPEDLWENWQDGGIKMQVVRSILRCRAEFPELFSLGDYLPLEVQGAEGDHFVAFMRRHESKRLIVVVPRRLGDEGSARADAFLSVPDGGQWKNLLTGQIVSSDKDSLSLDEVLSKGPVAVLLFQEKD